nr:hypothetical protein [Pseudomonas sp. s4]
MPIQHTSAEVQAILVDATEALGSESLSRIISHITSDPSILDADLELYHCFTMPESNTYKDSFRSVRSLNGSQVRFYMSPEETSLLINSLTERLSQAYEQDRSRENLRQYYVGFLSHKLGL